MIRVGSVGRTGSTVSRRLSSTTAGTRDTPVVLAGRALSVGHGWTTTMQILYSTDQIHAIYPNNHKQLLGLLI